MYVCVQSGGNEPLKFTANTSTLQKDGEDKEAHGLDMLDKGEQSGRRKIKKHSPMVSGDFFFLLSKCPTAGKIQVFSLLETGKSSRFQHELLIIFSN